MLAAHGAGLGDDRADCPAAPSGTWVALGLHGDGGTRWDLVDMRCDRIRGTDTQWPLTPATVSDWAGGGVTAYVPAPLRAAAGVEGYFRPMMG